MSCGNANRPNCKSIPVQEKVGKLCAMCQTKLKLYKLKKKWGLK